MHVSSIVERLISLSTDERQYLRAFGVTKITADLPPVFDQKFAPEWKNFLGIDCVHDSRSMLLTILRFVRYMKAQGVDPFVPNEPAPNVTIGRVMPELLRNDMSEQITKVSNWLTVARLMGVFRVKLRQTSGFYSRGNVVVYDDWVLAPKSDLDSALQSLKNVLYFDGGRLPRELAPKWRTVGTQRQSLLPPYAALLKIRNITVWHRSKVINNSEIWVKRSREDCLVLRIITNVRVLQQFADKNRTVNTIKTIWKTEFEPFK